MIYPRRVCYAIWLVLSIGSWLVAIKLLAIALAALPP